MKLRCKRCGSALRDETIDLSTLRARCPECDFRFFFEEDDVLSVGLGLSGEMATSEHPNVRVNRVGRSLIIRRLWKDDSVGWLMGITIAWYTLVFLGGIILVWTGLSAREGAVMNAILGSMALAGILLIAAVQQGLANRSWIVVGPKRLRVRSGPKGFFFQKRLTRELEIPTQSIRQVFAKMALCPSEGPSAHGCYDVFLQLDDESEEPLLYALPTEDESRLIVHSLQRELALPPASAASRRALESHVPRPARIESSRDRHELRLICRPCSRPTQMLTTAGTMLWLAFIGVLLFTTILGGPTSQLGPWALIPLVALAVVLVWVTLRYWFLRWTITVEFHGPGNRPLLRAWASPFPWRRSIRLSEEEIRVVYARSRRSQKRNPLRAFLGVTYEVVAVLRNPPEGKNRTSHDSDEEGSSGTRAEELSPARREQVILAGALHSSREAYFLNQELERVLELDDLPVENELPLPGSAKAHARQQIMGRHADLLRAFQLMASHDRTAAEENILPLVAKVWDQAARDDRLAMELAHALNCNLRQAKQRLLGLLNGGSKESIAEPASRPEVEESKSKENQKEPEPFSIFASIEGENNADPG